MFRGYKVIVGIAGVRSHAIIMRLSQLRTTTGQYDSFNRLLRDSARAQFDLWRREYFLPKWMASSF